MKTPKIIHYRLPVSRTFPADHPRKGEPTYFVEKINNSIGDTESCNVVVHSINGDIDIWPKPHTIRRNYKLWEKRMKKVHEGKAVIDIYYWEKPGGCYVKGNKQIVFATLDKDSGCGVQKLEFEEMIMTSSTVLITKYKGLDRIFRPRLKLELEDLAKNDGLSLEDFKAWFIKYDLSKPMAIIHFTKFRY